MSAIRDNGSRKTRRNVGGTNRERFGVSGSLSAEGGGARKRSKKPGRKTFWTHAAILQAIRVLGKELGHTPSAREIAASPDCPSERLVRMKFGSLCTAAKLAGLAPNRSGGQRVKVRRRVERSNHVWVLPPICPKKAAEITAAKAAHWGIRVEPLRSAEGATPPTAPALARIA